MELKSKDCLLCDEIIIGFYDKDIEQINWRPHFCKANKFWDNWKKTK